VNFSPSIDLGRSLRQLFGRDAASATQIEADCARQTATANAILQRLFAVDPKRRREISILADEVGLGKTYVALAVAVSILDAIRKNEAPSGLPSNKPVVLILTPQNDALFNKWCREVESFRRDCAREDGALSWLQIATPIEGSSKSGNVANLTEQIRKASRKAPMLLLAKQSAFGAALADRDWWRWRALAIVFEKFKVSFEDRQRWCRRVLGSGSQQAVPELLDLRRSYDLWNGADDISPNLYRAFERPLEDVKRHGRIEKALESADGHRFTKAIDDLTRDALVSDWPLLPLVVIDEVHSLKNEYVKARQGLEDLLGGRVSRLLGLSATPFQLRPNELLSVLKLRGVLSLSPERARALESAALELSDSLTNSKKAGDSFRTRWSALRSGDFDALSMQWTAHNQSTPDRQREVFRALRPPRVAHALEAAVELSVSNKRLREHLRPFVIRHMHPRGYRQHFVGRNADRASPGTEHFSWAPGMEVSGDEELSHYLMMRAIALSKDEKGLPGLGAELTGSYRHLVETSAVWRRLAEADNPVLREYRHVLDAAIGKRRGGNDPDVRHRKVQATVKQVLECFKKGQKTLIFCVFTKTAETLRDQIQQSVDEFLAQQREKLFGDETALANFRRRFFNRQEPLFSLIQDHPLLGASLRDRGVGIPSALALPEDALNLVATLLYEKGHPPDVEKPDRRLLLAATEHVAIGQWLDEPEGAEWLRGEQGVLRNCPELIDQISAPSWLESRGQLSRGRRSSQALRILDPEAHSRAKDPLDVETGDEGIRPVGGKLAKKAAIDAWVRRLREDAVGEVVAPYFQAGVCAKANMRLPLLVRHHQKSLAELNLRSGIVAGQVFRRVLMAEEFLLRYLSDVEKDNAERWSDYLANRYERPLAGHLESLRDRVQAYLETLVRGQLNDALMGGYEHAAENRNVIQLVKGGTSRDRYFLGFNTPYRPEILVSTQVGAEGIDLHRECRHVIHHDLCWNPATIEQRTGRVDRIGSKVERERLAHQANERPTLEIVVPYLAATYDERMFGELHRRAQLFEVTMGGDMRVDGRIDPDDEKAEAHRRSHEGIGTESEDLGSEGAEGAGLELPSNMVDELRVELSVWRPPK